MQKQVLMVVNTICGCMRVWLRIAKGTIGSEDAVQTKLIHDCIQF